MNIYKIDCEENMESINKALKLLDKHQIDESEDIVKYINYAKQVNIYKGELDNIDIEIIRCIMNPNNKLGITKYGGGDTYRSSQGVKVKEILSTVNLELEDGSNRIYGLIMSGYVEPLIPITSKFVEVSNAIEKIGIKSGTEEYADVVIILYKCTWLVEKLSDVDLSLAQEGYESYIRILFNDLYSYEESVKNIFQETTEKNNELTGNITESKKKLEMVEKNLKDSTTQSITILSIFAGVVMAFTGGMSYISQALAALNSIGPYRAGVFILLIGIVMFNLIFLLLYMIGKLTDKYTGSTMCKCEEPKIGCKNKRLNCSVKRYPYIIWFNLISLIIVTTILIVSFLDRYNLFVERFADIIISFAWYKLIQDVGLIICIFIVYGIFSYIIYKILKIRCNNS
jgi:hypothetical protein